MTTVFIVHGNDYEDQEIRSIHNTYREALAELDYPIIGAIDFSDLTISQWTVCEGEIERPTIRGYRVAAYRQKGEQWDFQVHVGSCEFDVEDDPIAHRVTDTSITVWALNKDAAGKLAFELMQTANEAMEVES